MTKTQSFAAKELGILVKSNTDPENRPVIEPFIPEILALCEKFGLSGQSGGSAPYTAGALSQVIKKLCLQEPICPVTGIGEEWVDVVEFMGKPMWQNNRCSALFKYEDGKCSYSDAIVWKGEADHDTFTGRVYVDLVDYELIGSSQLVRFPFTPKTFYIDVVRVFVTKEHAEQNNLHYIEDGFGKCYLSVLKDKNQLKAVFKYYDKK